MNPKPYEIVYSANQIYLTFYFRSKEQEQTCCNSFLCKVEPFRKFLNEANGLGLYSPCGQLTSGHVLWGIEQN